MNDRSIFLIELVLLSLIGLVAGVVLTGASKENAFYYGVFYITGFLVGWFCAWQCRKT